MPQERILDRTCLKIDKLNAMVMTEGYEKDGKIIRQAIYLKPRFKAEKYCKLLTLQKNSAGVKRWGPSEIGRRLDYDSFIFKEGYKYVAVLDSIYPVRDEKELWEKVCHNGLFDVWGLKAPEKWLHEDGKEFKTQCTILLLKVWEIAEPIPEEEINHSDMWDTLIRENIKVTLKKQVIDEGEFQQIKKLLKETVKDYLS